MTVRAKLELVEKNEKTWATELKFEARYDDTIPEDLRFEEATPTGTIVMQVTNKKALEQFRVGSHYYVDFNIAED